MRTEKNEFEVYDPITEYFNPMNLTPAEKKQRIATAKKFKIRIHDWFLSVYNDIKTGRYLHEKLDGDYIDDLIAAYIAMMESVDKTSMYDTEVNAKAMRFAEQVNQTNRNIINEPDNVEFTNTVMLGTGIREELIPSYVKHELSGGGDEWENYREILIATNETNWIYNYLIHKKKVESGQLTHTWESMRDEKVRGSHAIADGQTVPINEPFTVGGYKLLYPGDDSLGAPPSETIGCRCLEL